MSQGSHVAGVNVKRKKSFAARLLIISFYCFSLITLVIVGNFFFVGWFPVARELSKQNFHIEAPRPQEQLVPVYFWDYATWFNPTWFDRVEILLPYEKGLPKKLLPKIFFQNKTTRLVELELHGKRPRVYNTEEVLKLFENTIPTPWQWPLIIKLQKEAGLLTSSLKTLSLISLTHAISSTTHAIGKPWQHVFFWGPDGSVFQVRCSESCELARMIELIEFGSQPQSSLQERKNWTTQTLRKLLAERPTNQQDATYRSLLQLYLVSLLSLDPRNREAFFHLGKLSKNKQTVLAAIQYGKDLGLELEKTIELQAVADSLP